MGVALFVASKVLSRAGIEPGSVLGIAHLFQRQRPADVHRGDDAGQEMQSFTENTTRTSRSTSPRPGVEWTGLHRRVARLGTT